MGALSSPGGIYLWMIESLTERWATFQTVYSCPPTGDCYICPGLEPSVHCIDAAPVLCIDAASEDRFRHVPVQIQEDYIALGEEVVREETDGQ